MKQEVTGLIRNEKREVVGEMLECGHFFDYKATKSWPYPPRPAPRRICQTCAPNLQRKKYKCSGEGAYHD